MPFFLCDVHLRSSGSYFQLLCVFLFLSVLCIVVSVGQPCPCTHCLSYLSVDDRRHLCIHSGIESICFIHPFDLYTRVDSFERSDSMRSNDERKGIVDVTTGLRTLYITGSESVKGEWKASGGIDIKAEKWKDGRLGPAALLDREKPDENFDVIDRFGSALT